MTPEEKPNDTPKDAEPVDAWAAWYKAESEASAVKPVVLPAPSSTTILVPDISPDDMTEPNPA